MFYNTYHIGRDIIRRVAKDMDISLLEEDVTPDSGLLPRPPAPPLPSPVWCRLPLSLRPCRLLNLHQSEQTGIASCSA